MLVLRSHERASASGDVAHETDDGVRGFSERGRGERERERRKSEEGTEGLGRVV